MALFCAVAILVIVAGPASAADEAHGHDCETATSITLNSDLHVVLHNSIDFAVYRMALDRRGLFNVWTDPGSFSVWDIELLNAACSPVYGVFAGTSAITGIYSKITVPSFNIKPMENVWTLAPGVYYLRLHPDPVLKNGEPFIVHNKFIAHYGHDCATAEPVPASGSINGYLLYEQDREVFHVTVNPPASIHAWTTADRATIDQPRIDLFFSDCSSAAQMQVNAESEAGITTTMLEVGTYYISVEPFRKDLLGPYTLHVELVNDQESW